MAVINVTSSDFEEIVLKSDKPVLVDFWASWCGPCRMVGPIVEDISNEREDILVCKVNVDEEPDLAIEYKVMSIPMMIVFKNGQIYNKSIGAVPKQEIISLLD